MLVASFRSINIQMGPPLALHICHLEFISLDLCPGHACASEKAMAPHSSTLTWKIPWTEEPGRLQSMGLLRVD